MTTPGRLIRKILIKFQKGDNEEYDMLLSSLSNPNTASSALKNSIRGLTDCVSMINNSKETLMTVILEMDWLIKEDSVIKAYQNLLVNLMSAGTDYAHCSLNMLVKYLIPDLKGVTVEDGNYMVTDVMRQNHEKNFTHIHKALSDTYKIVPLTPMLLMPILEKRFPFYKTDTYIQSCYVKNLLQIIPYMPSLRQQILDLIVTKLLKLDVLSPRHDLNESVDAEDSDIFEMEDGELNTLELTNEAGKNTEECNIKEEKTKEEHREAKCLDNLMDMLLEYIHRECHPNGGFDLERSKKLYWELISIFDKVILPTHESSHIQFILFYMASFKPILVDGFLDYLWKTVQNPNTPIIYRQTAVSYMASLLSRALFIPILTVISCVDIMVAWLHSYLDNLSEDKQPNYLLHGTFYAVSQAVFYIFCFRNSEIFQSKKGYKWAEALNFQRIVTSRLNPLRYCLPIVVSTFASYTRRHQLAFCDTVIERNNRCMIPVVNSSTGQTEINLSLKLASFFPFDPYLLPRSGKRISSIYRVYSGDIQEDSQESEEDDDFLPDQAMEPVSTTPGTSLTYHMTEDLLMYSTSPGFKTC